VTAGLSRLGLSLAERAFRAGAGARTAAYDLGALPVERVEGAAVVSIGNIRVGGSGKTPVALWLASEIAKGGAPTAIALRGYGGSLSGRGGVVSRGDGPIVSAREAGDEAYLAALRAPAGVSVHVGADRVGAVRRAVLEGARAVVLDDGFQHRRLRRDCDVVLVCPDDLAPGTRALPLGPLREPPTALRRAHIVAGLAAEWRDRQGAPDVLFDALPGGLVGVDGAPSPPEGRDRRAFAFAGIARPERFLRTAADAGFDVVGARLFPDHHRFAARDLAAVAEAAARCGAELLLTTEKDLVRLGAVRNFPPIFAIRLHMRIAAGASIFEETLRRAGVETALQRA
jgi:tetraacyldisaccharide 4'-kinase